MKIKPCQYCGNNPVPHRLFWYQESLNLALEPLRNKLFYNPLFRWFNASGLSAVVARAMLFFGVKVKIFSFQCSSQKCKVRRAQVLWQEAESRGITMRELLLFGRPFDTYVAEKVVAAGAVGRPEKKLLIFSGLPRPAGYFNRNLDLMDDKWWLKKTFLKESLPVPAGGAATSLSKALKFFSQVSHPVIVKPRSGSRGRHTTTFVYNREDLKKAFKIAKQLCYWVMVEEQLSGPVYRATVINFKLAGVLRGDSPQVTGDGASTLLQLIYAKNQQAKTGVKAIVPDESMKLFLERQGLNLTSVLNKDRLVNLSEKIGVNYGGSSSEDFDICHPQTKLMFERAAKVLGDPIVGFDFIIPNISKSYHEQKCGFIEVNSLPFINLHHDPLLGTSRNVAAKVWEATGW